MKKDAMAMTMQALDHLITLTAKRRRRNRVKDNFDLMLTSERGVTEPNLNFILLKRSNFSSTIGTNIDFSGEIFGS